ncbi:MAG: beta-propeller fold lactonase family protein [Legionellaceae bacterium]|nr:beta-propeller fold lactonase family protein [Legionellaceae bacterium]
MIKTIITAVGVFIDISSFAAQPIFTVASTAENANIIEISSSASTTAMYQVTNNTQITRTLTTKPLPGITLNTTTSGACSNPFTLAHGQSCTLNLSINGSLLPANGIFQGPEVCKTQGSGTTPDPFLCSRPSQEQQLMIRNAVPILYTSNRNIDAVNQCLINPATGLLHDCLNIDTSQFGLVAPSSVAINPNGQLLYIQDEDLDKIFKCDLSAVTGHVTNCVDSGATGITGTTPQQFMFNQSNTKTYIAASIGPGSTQGTVLICDKNPNTGNIGACVDSGANKTTLGGYKPLTIIFNQSETRAYIVTYDTNITPGFVYKCSINQNTGVLSDCSDSGATNLHFPTSMTLNTAQTRAYMTNAEDGVDNVTICNINQTNGDLSGCYVSSAGPFDYPTTIIFNAAQTLAYIANWQGNSISTCEINQSTGDLGACVDSGATGLGLPSTEGLALR